MDNCFTDLIYIYIYIFKEQVLKLAENAWIWTSLLLLIHWHKLSSWNFQICSTTLLKLLYSLKHVMFILFFQQCTTIDYEIACTQKYYNKTKKTYNKTKICQFKFTRGSVQGILKPSLAELHTQRLIQLDPLTDRVINSFKM